MVVPRSRTARYGPQLLCRRHLRFVTCCQGQRHQSWTV